MKKRAWQSIAALIPAAAGCVSEPTYTHRSYYAPGVPYQTNSVNASAVPSDRPIGIESPTFHEPPKKKGRSFWAWLTGKPKQEEETYALPFPSWTRPDTQRADE